MSPHFELGGLISFFQFCYVHVAELSQGSINVGMCGGDNLTHMCLQRYNADCKKKTGASIWPGYVGSNTNNEQNKNEVLNSVYENPCLLRSTFASTTVGGRYSSLSVKFISYVENFSWF
jgi:hypothetical protein